MPAFAINAERLNRTLYELGKFGETSEGMDRLAFSPADVESRDYTMELMREAGLEVRIDAGGNIIGRKAGSDDSLPTIAMGSHTDTVPLGGKYDGALGVMGAIEVIKTLAENGHKTRHPIEAIVFTNEEGTRFHRWLIGSRAMAGMLEPEDLVVVDAEGVLWPNGWVISAVTCRGSRRPPANPGTWQPISSFTSSRDPTSTAPAFP